MPDHDMVVQFNLKSIGGRCVGKRLRLDWRPAAFAHWQSF